MGEEFRHILYHLNDRGFIAIWMSVGNACGGACCSSSRRGATILKSVGSGSIHTGSSNAKRWPRITKDNDYQEWAQEAIPILMWPP